MAAICQTIAAHWKHTGTPPFGAFAECLNSIMRMEELTAIANNKSSQFFGLWQTWLLFRDSDELE